MLRFLSLCGLLVSPTLIFAEPADEPRRFAVRVPAEATELAKKVLEGAFQRWIVPHDDRVELVVGPDVTGDVVIEARLFPIEERLAERLADLPVHLRGEAIVLDGTTYRDDRHALAVRLPAGKAPTWVVSGYHANATASLVDQVLISASGRRWGGMKEDLDYRLREHRWAHRSGRWRTTDSGVAAVDERDDFTEREAAYAALRPIRQPHVVLRVPAERAQDPEMTALAEDLEAAAVAMAARIPLRLETPVEVLVESDFTAQGRHLDAIGAAVLSEDGSLHLVHHPEDLFAYRHELARTLLRRSTLVLPPWLEAALHLSGDWYGRTYDDWAADLAALDALPSASELLAGERQGDGSAVLWPPVAAAAVARLPGATLSEKLAELPAPIRLAKILDELPSRTTPTRPAPNVARAAAKPSRFQRGASFDMANGLEVGYHAPGVGDQLQHLRLLGVDSVSLMPFAYQPSPRRAGAELPEPQPRLRDRRRHRTRRPPHPRSRLQRAVEAPHLGLPRQLAGGDRDDQRGCLGGVVARLPPLRAPLRGARRMDWMRAVLDRRRARPHRREGGGVALADPGGAPGVLRPPDLLRQLGRRLRDRALLGRPRLHRRRRLLPALRPPRRRPRDPRCRRPARRRRAASGGRALPQAGDPHRGRLRGPPRRLGRAPPGGRRGLRGASGPGLSRLLDTLGRPPWLACLYVWKVFSHRDAEDRGRPDFRVLGREAEAVIRGYFREPRPLATSQR